jgi:hypothetical protein
MLTKTKTAIVAAVLISSASFAFAALDGDSNPIPGGHQYGAIVEQTMPAFVNTFASTRRGAPAHRLELDGDGNRVPGRW